MTTIKTPIQGFDVELDLGERSQCLISKDDRWRASLAAAEDTGLLAADRELDVDIPISDEAINEITRWALDHGY